MTRITYVCVFIDSIALRDRNRKLFKMYVVVFAAFSQSEATFLKIIGVYNTWESAVKAAKDCSPEADFSFKGNCTWMESKNGVHSVTQIECCVANE